MLTICLLASIFLAAPASAQCALQTFNGTTWAFQLSDGVYDSAIGWFTMYAVPKIGVPGYQGELTITESINNRGAIQVQTTVIGQYTVDPSAAGPPCTGTLTFTGSFNNLQPLRFDTDSVGNRMFLLSTIGTSQVDDPIVHGTARELPAIPACPLQFAISGVWTFITSEYRDGTVGVINFVPTSSTGGTVTVTETAIENAGSPRVQQTYKGTYVLAPDCSGGILLFDSGTEVGSYAFIFAESDQFYMVAIGGSGGGLLFGQSGFAVR